MSEINVKTVRKDDLERKVIELTIEIEELRRKKGDIENLIKRKSDKLFKIRHEISIKEKLLSVSEHAFERFKERIIDIPRTKIRDILTSKEMLIKYKLKGDGEYKIKGLPGTCVIRDYTIITCINRNDITKQLENARKYIHYKIDCWCEEALGNKVRIMTFKEFKRKSYH